MHTENEVQCACESLIRNNPNNLLLMRKIYEYTLNHKISITGINWLKKEKALLYLHFKRDKEFGMSPVFAEISTDATLLAFAILNRIKIKQYVYSRINLDIKRER